MKLLSKILLALYLAILLWLVLFKFSFDLSSVLDHSTRSLNLIPFIGSSRGSLREMVYNFAVFIPLGLLLYVNLKRAGFWQKLALIFIFSLAVEIVQFVFAIGAADVTDIVTNTSGGLLGLVLYDLAKKCVDNQKLDQFITIAGAALIALLILFLGILSSNGVRYQSAPSNEDHRPRTYIAPIYT
jgi:glycopeptide antibiotics resistance protein